MANGRPPHAPDPIAIVGVGCKLPGNISSLESLFATLRDGRDCVTEVPPDRWNVDELYDADPLIAGKTYVRHGGFVSDIDQFDAGFFGIPDAEAARMDPQQRMALQTVWHALENAGQSAEELAGSDTGVFLAMMNTNGYAQLKVKFEGLRGVNGYDAIGDAMSITAGRISHFLGLEGPCVAVDTACSGSMVAIHLARQAILAGDCDTAIVLGVSAILHPGIHIAFSKVGLLSRAGRCAAFDDSADGYVRGEGCMAVILRRQSVAIARGDHILASIVGTGVNQDGHTPALTAPNGQAQEDVMRLTLSRASIVPHDIRYVEAHGTGTPVGDPIEMTALANVYGRGRSEGDPLFVGSAKSNFGHIESGAGILGVVKAALSLDQQVIFPSLHFKRLNSHIHVDGTPIQVPTQTMPWPRGERRRMAGVNSFGYSGTNAHAVLQEAPVAGGDAPAAERPCELVVLSAKSAAGLQSVADQWVALLAQDSTTSLPDLAFTAATGRSHLRHRVAIVGRGKTEIREKLRAWREGRTPTGLAAGQTTVGRKRKIAFVFTGQGAQYAQMGRQLYQLEPSFRVAIDRCAELMDADGVALHEVLFGTSAAELLSDTRYVQPALFAVEYALAELLGHWGIEPDYVIGHSVGEIVAACVAGVLDLESAVRFVVARGRLMGQLPRGGKMLAVEAPYEQALEWVKGRETDVSIAAVNGPTSVVISGRAAAIDEVAGLAAAATRRSKELEVSHAFHSPLMEPILDELTAVAASLRIRPAKIPIVSNVTGTLQQGEIPSAYWSAHVRQAVLFHQGIRSLVDAGCSLLIEVGPQAALTPSMVAASDPSTVQCVPTLKRDRQDLAHLFETLASLHVIGVPLRLTRLFEHSGRHRVSAPLYPFRPDSHWLHAEKPVEPPVKVKRVLHALLGESVSDGTRGAVFEVTLAASHPWVGHRILDATVFPGTAYLEMAARGFAAVTGADWRPVVLRDVRFERPLILAYGKPKKVQLTLEHLSTGANAESTFVIAAADGAQERYCRGRIAGASDVVEQVSIQTELGRTELRLPIGPFYGELRKAGLEYGASFSTVRELWRGKAGSGEAVGRITASAHKEGADEHPFQNTVLLDGCLHVFGASLQTLSEDQYRGAFIPASIQAITLRRQLPAQVWSHVSLKGNGDGRAAMARIRVLNDGGEVLADIEGLELLNKSSFSSAKPGTAAAATAKAAAPITESRAQLVARLRDLSRDQRVDLIVKWLASEVRDIMGQAAEEIDWDNIDPTMAFLELGLDSLLVTELQRRIQEKLDFRYQPMQALDYQTIDALGEFILDQVLVIDSPQEPAADLAETHPTV